MTEVNQAGLRLPAWRGVGQLWLKTGARANDRAERSRSALTRRLRPVPGRVSSQPWGVNPGSGRPTVTGRLGRHSSGPRSPLGWVPWLLLGLRRGRGRGAGRRRGARGRLRGRAGVCGDGAWLAHRRAPAQRRSSRKSRAARASWSGPSPSWRSRRPRPCGGSRWRSSSGTRTPARTSSGSGASRRCWPNRSAWSRTSAERSVTRRRCTMWARSRFPTRSC